MRAADGTVGRVVSAGLSSAPGKRRVQRDDNRLSVKSYRVEQLVETSFDPLPLLLRGAPPSLAGSRVSLWWQRKASGGEWQAPG